MEANEEGKATEGGSGGKLDEAVEQVGAALEDKVSEPAEKVADKVVDASGGMPDDQR